MSDVLELIKLALPTTISLINLLISTNKFGKEDKVKHMKNLPFYKYGESVLNEALKEYWDINKDPSDILIGMECNCKVHNMLITLTNIADKVDDFPDLYNERKKIRYEVSKLKELSKCMDDNIPALDEDQRQEYINEDGQMIDEFDDFQLIIDATDVEIIEVSEELNQILLPIYREFGENIERLYIWFKQQIEK